MGDQYFILYQTDYNDELLSGFEILILDIYFHVHRSIAEAMQITRVTFRIKQRLKILIYSAFIKLGSRHRLVKVRESLEAVIKNKDVFILGSAPDPDLSLLASNSILVCVNGSAASAAKLGLKRPRLTIIDFELVDPNINLDKPARSVIIKNNLLKDLELGTLLITQSNNSKGGDPSCICAKYDKALRLFKYDCMCIVHAITKSSVLERNINGLLSRGGMAIAVCAWLGAKSVSFSGFSVFKNRKMIEPHFYSELGNRVDRSLGSVDWSLASMISSDWDVRNHSMADFALMALLRISGFDIRCSHKDFAPVLYNWGVDPPDRAR